METDSPMDRSTDVPTLSSLRQPTSFLQKSEDYVVPNVVHYVWFGEYNTLRFHHYLSMRSAHIFIKPDKICIHCDFEPVGKWWKLIRKDTPNLVIIKTIPLTTIFKNKIILPEHKSDIARIQILMEEGGIYLDTDVLVLKSFRELRKYEMTMGIEYHGNPGRLNNGIIIAKKNAAFLQIWYDTYTNFSKREWDFHDCIVPYRLQYLYPKLIHIEENTLNYPSGKNLDLIYENVFDWRNNYAMHLWYRLYDIDHTPIGIRNMNTTFGEMARLIYYNSTKLMTR